MSDQPTRDESPMEFLARLTGLPLEDIVDEGVSVRGEVGLLDWSSDDPEAWNTAYLEMADVWPDRATELASAFIATVMEVGRRNPAPPATAPIPSTAEYDQPPPAEPADEPADEPATHVLAEPYTGPWIGVGDNMAPKPEPET